MQHHRPTLVEQVTHLSAIRLADVLEHLRVGIAHLVHHTALQAELQLVAAGTLRAQLWNTQQHGKQTQNKLALTSIHTKSLQSYDFFFKYANFMAFFLLFARVRVRNEMRKCRAMSGGENSRLAVRQSYYLFGNTFG